MATSYETVYAAFLSKVLDDEWGCGHPYLDYVEQEMTKEQLEMEWKEILKAAIPWIKFPRVSLEMSEDGFVEEIPNQLLQVIVYYMVYVWASKCVLTWENIKPLYEERDFSQANLLDKLNETAEQARKEAKRLEDVYYRSRDGKSFDYSLLAGDTL